MQARFFGNICQVLANTSTVDILCQMSFISPGNRASALHHLFNRKDKRAINEQFKRLSYWAASPDCWVGNQPNLRDTITLPNLLSHYVNAMPIDKTEQQLINQCFAHLCLAIYHYHHRSHPNKITDHFKKCQLIAAGGNYLWHVVHEHFINATAFHYRTKKLFSYYPTYHYKIKNNLAYLRQEATLNIVASQWGKNEGSLISAPGSEIDKNIGIHFSRPTWRDQLMHEAVLLLNAEPNRIDATNLGQYVLAIEMLAKHYPSQTKKSLNRTAQHLANQLVTSTTSTREKISIKLVYGLLSSKTLRLLESKPLKRIINFALLNNHLGYHRNLQKGILNGINLLAERGENTIDFLSILLNHSEHHAAYFYGLCYLLSKDQAPRHKLELATVCQQLIDLNDYHISNQGNIEFNQRIPAEKRCLYLLVLADNLSQEACYANLIEIIQSNSLYKEKHFYNLLKPITLQLSETFLDLLSIFLFENYHKDQDIHGNVIKKRTRFINYYLALITPKFSADFALDFFQSVYIDIDDFSIFALSLLTNFELNFDQQDRFLTIFSRHPAIQDKIFRPGYSQSLTLGNKILTRIMNQFSDLTCFIEKIYPLVEKYTAASIARGSPFVEASFSYMSCLEDIDEYFHYAIRNTRQKNHSNLFFSLSNWLFKLDEQEISSLAREANAIKNQPFFLDKLEKNCIKRFNPSEEHGLKSNQAFLLKN